MAVAVMGWWPTAVHAQDTADEAQGEEVPSSLVASPLDLEAAPTEEAPTTQSASSSPALGTPSLDWPLVRPALIRRVPLDRGPGVPWAWVFDRQREVVYLKLDAHLAAYDFEGTEVARGPLPATPDGTLTLDGDLFSNLGSMFYQHDPATLDVVASWDLSAHNINPSIAAVGSELVFRAPTQAGPPSSGWIAPPARSPRNP